MCALSETKLNEKGVRWLAGCLAWREGGRQEVALLLSG